jgi:hypothetical protein
MSICDNGGQLEKERPLKRSSVEAERKAPKKPPKPQMPYKLAGNQPQCTFKHPLDGAPCGWLRENPADPNGLCKVHTWEALYGPEED